MPSIFSRLFGSSSPAAPKALEPILHKDCRIFAEPMKAEGGYRLAARIEKDIGGETKTHHLIRADIHSAQDEAIAASIAKAQQAIDQLGDRLFS